MKRLLSPLFLLLFYAVYSYHHRTSFSRKTVIIMSSKPPGVGFTYDSKKFVDPNAGNNRRYSDQVAAKNFEEQLIAKEKAEMLRKEAMERMERKRKQDVFEKTPRDKIVATSDKYSVSPEILKVIADLDQQLVGLQPVKDTIRMYASRYLVHKIRQDVGLRSEIPPLHHIFTGNPGTGKTTVAMKLSELYKAMGYLQSGHTVVATRADLVGQYIGHTGPKTRETILRSFGGVLFIDEAYGLYKEDSRDYGSEVIELLIKFIDTTENTDFVVVLAGYYDLMRGMLEKNPRLYTRIGNWIDFPDYSDEELLRISCMLARQYGYYYDEATQAKFLEYMALRKQFPYFSNARTVRNAMERARRLAATRILNQVSHVTEKLENQQRIRQQILQERADAALLHDDEEVVGSGIDTTVDEQEGYYDVWEIPEEERLVDENAPDLVFSEEEMQNVDADKLRRQGYICLDDLQTFDVLDFQVMVDEIKDLPRTTTLP